MSKLLNNTTSLQSILERINNLPEAGSGGIELPELTNAGGAADLLEGKELIDQHGSKVTGTFTIDNELNEQDELLAELEEILNTKAAGGDANPILQSKTVSPTTSSQTVTADSGYDGLSRVTVNAMPTAVQATPSISVDANGNITASVIQNAGYVTAGTKSATKQLTTKAATTITPTTTSQVAVSAGTYVTGDITVEAIENSGGGSSAETEILNGILYGTLTSYSNNELIKIKTGLFAECSSLSTVNIPNCTNVGIYAFANCKNLTSIDFSYCTKVDNYAFANCTNLTTLNLPLCSSFGTYVLSNCTNLETVNLLELSYIGAYAFSNCNKLTTLNLPKGNNIGGGAFSKCYNLKSLYLTSTSICRLQNSNAFTSTPIGGYSASAGTYGSIYVPASLLASYQTATNWTYFSSRMVGI